MAPRLYTRGSVLIAAVGIVALVPPANAQSGAGKRNVAHKPLVGTQCEKHRASDLDHKACERWCTESSKGATTRSHCEWCKCKACRFCLALEDPEDEPSTQAAPVQQFPPPPLPPPPPALASLLDDASPPSPALSKTVSAESPPSAHRARPMQSEDMLPPLPSSHSTGSPPPQPTSAPATSQSTSAPPRAAAPSAAQLSPPPAAGPSPPTIQLSPSPRPRPWSLPPPSPLPREPPPVLSSPSAALRPPPRPPSPTASSAPASEASSASSSPPPPAVATASASRAQAAAPTSTAKPPPLSKCVFADRRRDLLYDLGHLSTLRDVRIDGDPGRDGDSLDSLLASILGGGMPGRASGGRSYSIYFSLCGANTEHTCAGSDFAAELAEPAVGRGSSLSTKGADVGIVGVVEYSSAGNWMASECRVLARAVEPSWTPMDDPETGLQVLYGRGSLCKQGKHSQLLFVLQCELEAVHSTAAVSEQRDSCLWVIRISSAAACPVRSEAQCSPNCLRSWLGDGECDPSCHNEACAFDKGDCEGSPQHLTAATAHCSPGCEGSWLGDHECDVECDNEACRFDDGDCSAICAPGCQQSYLGDGECDIECNTPTCGYDGGDCQSVRAPSARCAWGCPPSWRGDGQCDAGCNVTACSYDDGDCGVKLPPPPPPSPPPPSPKPRRCAWSPPGSDLLFDLGPLAHLHDLKFQTGSGVDEGDPFATFFRRAGMGGLPGSLGGGQTMYLSICGENSGTCAGESAAAIVTTEPAHPLAPTTPGCEVLGRLSSRRFALLDDGHPGRGLQIMLGKGDECRPNRRHQLVIILVCRLSAQGPGEVEDVQQRDACLWVVRVASAAACPVRSEAQCAPNCPRSWLGDGECDPSCHNEACAFDKGDCEGSPQPLTAATAHCSPGCEGSWLGDHECDVECDNEACRFDDGDCSAICAPGCQQSYLGDNECDDECNTPTCGYDGGDCNGVRAPVDRCAWGCPLSWRGDGQCDAGCNVTACAYDDGDCGVKLSAPSPPPPPRSAQSPVLARGARRAPPPPPPSALSKLLSTSLPPQLREFVAPFFDWLPLLSAVRRGKARLPIEVLIAVGGLLACCCLSSCACCYCRLRSYLRYRSYRVVDDGISDALSDELELS